MKDKIKNQFSKAITQTSAVIVALMGTVPEEARESLKTLEGRLAEVQKTVDAVADGDAEGGTALLLAGAFNCLGEVNAEAKKAVDAAQAKILALNGTISELQNKVVEFDGQVKSGALVTKEQAQELAALAREEGAREAAGRFEVREKRTKALATCGLALPTDAKALEGTDEEFSARQQTAASRMEELKKRGFSLNGPGKTLLAGILWADEEAHKAQMALVDETLKARGTTPGEPLLGGGAGAGGGGEPRIVGAV